MITGSEKAFAAGADIKEMQAKSYVEAYLGRLLRRLGAMSARMRKPIIAAVAGYALGGGCELAMMCDFIIAADNAKFGQPEITLGVMPGMGGSQRLTRFVGKSKAMDMCLTGRMMDAAEAERCGLVSRVVPAGELLEEALKAAAKIAEFSLPAVMMAKEAVNRAYETTLAEGLRFERRLFHSMFALEDQKEGMAAFAEKRNAEFHATAERRLRAKLPAESGVDAPAKLHYKPPPTEAALWLPVCFLRPAGYARGAAHRDRREASWPIHPRPKRQRARSPAAQRSTRTGARASAPIVRKVEEALAAGDKAAAEAAFKAAQPELMRAATKGVHAQEHGFAEGFAPGPAGEDAVRLIRLSGFDIVEDPALRAGFFVCRAKTWRMPAWPRSRGSRNFFAGICGDLAIRQGRK